MLILHALQACPTSKMPIMTLASQTAELIRWYSVKSVYQRVSCQKLPCLEAHAAKPVAFYENQQRQQQHEVAAADPGAVYDPAALAAEQGSKLTWAVHEL